MGKPERTFGFNVISPIRANAGLAVLARNVVRVLVQRGDCSIDTSFGGSGGDSC